MEKLVVASIEWSPGEVKTMIKFSSAQKSVPDFYGRGSVRHFFVHQSELLTAPVVVENLTSQPSLIPFRQIFSGNRAFFPKKRSHNQYRH